MGLVPERGLAEGVDPKIMTRTAFHAINPKIRSSKVLVIAILCFHYAITIIFTA